MKLTPALRSASIEAAMWLTRQPSTVCGLVANSSTRVTRSIVPPTA
jgi:hypothetical protein